MSDPPPRARLWSFLRERRGQRRDFSRSGPPLSPAQVEAASPALGLDVYESADPDRPGRWRPRAGYRGMFGKVLEAKRAAGRVVAVRHMEAASRALGIAPDDLAVEVNPSFLWQVERVVAGMCAAGSRVVILTLPGLYAPDREPSARALTIGHLPAFTDTLRPPESHFVDSVHLDESARRQAGVWLGAALEPRLAEVAAP